MSQKFKEEEMVRKLWKQQMDKNSVNFGDWIYKLIPKSEAIESYAEYRSELAVAISQGAGVPFVRNFKEWLKKEPYEK